jgi:hypothetical protein
MVESDNWELSSFKFYVEVCRKCTVWYWFVARSRT